MPSFLLLIPCAESVLLSALSHPLFHISFPLTERLGNPSPCAMAEVTI